MISTDQLSWIKQQIRLVPNAKVYAFGSRVKGNPRPHSDFDVAIDNQTPIPLNTLSKLEEVFAESDLPFLIDIVDFQRINNEFQQHMLASSEMLLNGSS